jgi:hypothetical protein
MVSELFTMFPALTRLLDVDPAKEVTAALGGTIEAKILERGPPAVALSNGLHNDLLRLGTEGRLSALEVVRLQVTWVLGRYRNLSLE